MNLPTPTELGRRVWTPAILCGLLAITWLVFAGVTDQYWVGVVVKMFITLCIVLGLQIFSGNSGVLSFGHVAFVAVGAYSSALVTMSEFAKQTALPQMPHWLSSWIFPAQVGTTMGVLIGGLAAMIVAALAAPVVVRLAGIAAGIATLAIAVIVNEFINEADAVTAGKNTLVGVPATTTLATVALWSIILVAVAYAFQQSKIGLKLRASRENGKAAQSIGVNIKRARGIAWILSGFVAGVAGALYGHFFNSFSGADFYFNNGLNLILLTVAMLVVGGMTSVTGAVVGCYAVTIVYTIFNRWEVTGYFGYIPPSGIANLAVSLLLVLALAARPTGLTGGREIPWIGEWRFGRRCASSAPAATASGDQAAATRDSRVTTRASATE